MDHEGCWAQAGSSAQSSPCRICSLETRSMHGFGETSGSLINSLNLRLHSHSGVDDATAPIQGGAGGTTRQEREHSGVGEQDALQTLKGSCGLRDTRYPLVSARGPG